MKLRFRSQATNAATKMSPKRPYSLVPTVLLAMAAGILVIGALLFLHARGATNHLALFTQPKRVSVIEAAPATYRPRRRYVGTLQAWGEARIGPQIVSAYVQTVLVRPGDTVKQNSVLATLDCRNASAMEKTIAMQAQALEATQAAIAREAARQTKLLDKGFAAANEVEQKQADSASKEAQLIGLQEQMRGKALEVSDCVLRAPFDGEIADREADPGAFVRPDTSIATLIDRTTVRVTTDVPEDDFGAVAPDTPVDIHVIATGQTRQGTITRRAPAADATTRTIHLEIDLPNADRSLPVGTTAEVTLEVGQPAPALEIPLRAAAVRAGKAKVFVVTGDVAKLTLLDVMGELNGALFVQPEVPAGALVVTMGRTTLFDGDRVSATREAERVAEKTGGKK